MPTPPQAQLQRSLGLFSVIVLVISSIIGSGVYKKVAPMSAELLSPTLVLVAWLLAGVISLCGALSNAEIAGMLADSGGEYVYFRKIYGRWFAFIYGWACFSVIKSAAVASIAYVFAQSFHSLVPLPSLPPELAGWSLWGIFQPLDNFGVKALTILLIWSLTWLNIKGLKFGNGFSQGITLLVLVGIGAIVVLGLSLGANGWQNLLTPAGAYVPRTWQDPALWQSMFVAMLGAFWAYEGWNSIGYLGGEIKNAQRNLPLSLATGTLVVIGVYLLINFTYLYVLPMDQMVAVFQAKNQIAAVAVMQHLLGHGGALFISLLILATTLGATNSTILPPPRLYYAMAKDGLFFPGAAQIHPTNHTPAFALGLQAIWASVLVLSGSFDQLTDMLIFAAFIFYGATALGVFILRAREPQAPRPYKVVGYPVVPALFVVFCVLLVGVTVLNRPREAGLGLGLILTGLPFYFYWTRGQRG
jgi:basic amino acid/polyamine antiporter, APA family